MFEFVALLLAGPWMTGAPVPLTPWTVERSEVTSAQCEAPDDATILRALGEVHRGVPGIYEESRDDIEIVTERVGDRIDEPRDFPLIGRAQLYHSHYKCSVYFMETVESGYPFPIRVKRPRVEVVYIDKDHLHPCKGEASKPEK